MRQRELQSIIKLYEKSLQKLQNMKPKYLEKIKKELNEVGKSVINDWYKEYSPNIYKRLGSLYKAFRVQVKKDGSYSVSFSSSYMKAFHHITNKKHPIDNEYIFQNSFMEGWHGGADKGKNHPFPGYPMYREPYPYFTRWYYIAEQSFSPYERMVDEMKAKLEEIENEYDEEFQKEILNKIKKKISQLKGGK